MINIKKNIFITFYCFLCLILSCNKKVEKKDFVNSIRLIKKERVNILKTNKWELKRIYVRDMSDGFITSKDRVRLEDIKYKTFEFKDKEICLNSKTIGIPDYAHELFIINNIDTLTNKYYINRLKEDILVLRNDIGYFKKKKRIKYFTIELFLVKKPRCAKSVTLSNYN